MTATKASRFELAAQLRTDCHVLGRLPLSHVLLLDKREVPWFILVPETGVARRLERPRQHEPRRYREVKALRRYVRARFQVTKLNVAAIGNIVSQLHVHVIGRHPQDPWWPHVAWGQTSAGGYADAEVRAIAQRVAAELGADFQSL